MEWWVKHLYRHPCSISRIFVCHGLEAASDRCHPFKHRPGSTGSLKECQGRLLLPCRVFIKTLNKKNWRVMHASLNKGGSGRMNLCPPPPASVWIGALSGLLSGQRFSEFSRKNSRLLMCAKQLQIPWGKRSEGGWVEGNKKRRVTLPRKLNPPFLSPRSQLQVQRGLTTARSHVDTAVSRSAPPASGWLIFREPRKPSPAGCLHPQTKRQSPLGPSEAPLSAPSLAPFFFFFGPGCESGTERAAAALFSLPCPNARWPDPNGASADGEVPVPAAGPDALPGLTGCPPPTSQLSLGSAIASTQLLGQEAPPRKGWRSKTRRCAG